RKSIGPRYEKARRNGESRRHCERDEGARTARRCARALRDAFVCHQGRRHYRLPGSQSTREHHPVRASVRQRGLLRVKWLRTEGWYIGSMSRFVLRSVTLVAFLAETATSSRSRRDGSCFLFAWIDTTRSECFASHSNRV